MLPNLLLVFLLIWSALLTFFLFRIAIHYNHLTNKTDKKRLKDILEEILKKQDAHTKDIEKLINGLSKLENNAKFHFQKIGLVRFNPFSDSGGNQSFVLVFLDGHDSGLIISSLHGRSQTRWYAKTITNGKPFEHDLSEEEKEAFNQALKSKN